MEPPPTSSPSGLQPPAPPSPSADKSIAPSLPDNLPDQEELPSSQDIDIFTLRPLAALKMLSDMLETLVHITGDVPPTPPALPQSREECVGTNKENEGPHGSMDRSQKRRSRQWVADDGDVPQRAKTPIGSPEARPHEPVHIEIVDAEVEPLVPQHLAVARKFYSKQPPPISLEEYLKRLHRYCPMSTGVYLAASLYIHRLALVQKLVPVAPRNVHRLVLAGLRVTMKALEDLSYPHSRFAKVGGVTESELKRLEISFCFVMNFEFRATREMLLEHARISRQAAEVGRLSVKFQPRLPIKPRKSSSMALTEGTEQLGIGT